MQDTLMTAARAASEARTAALLARAHAGPSLATRMAELALQGGQARLTMSADELARTAELCRRDLGTTVGTAGGFLVGVSNNPLEELLIGAELADLGVRVVGGLAGPGNVPRVSSLPTGAWLPADGAPVSESQGTLGQHSISPKYLAARVDVSRSLVLQSAANVADAVVGPMLAESFRRTVFTALFSGTGSAGAPLGLLNRPGFSSVSGTSLSAVGLRSMLRATLDAGAREANVRFVADPATAEILGSREFSTGSGLPCWHAGQVLGRPAVATNLMPANTCVAADFSRAVLWLFDRDGAGLEVDPFSSFTSGAIGYRLIIGADLTFSPLASFAVATGVS
jgi:HK97 family phage major capsid protein